MKHKIYPSMEVLLYALKLARRSGDVKEYHLAFVRAAVGYVRQLNREGLTYEDLDADEREVLLGLEEHLEWLRRVLPDDYQEGG